VGSAAARDSMRSCGTATDRRSQPRLAFNFAEILIGPDGSGSRSVRAMWTIDAEGHDVLRAVSAREERPEPIETIAFAHRAKMERSGQSALRPSLTTPPRAHVDDGLACAFGHTASDRMPRI
jgi:hypothetical protein